MTPLSAALAGVVPPHDNFSPHLDYSGNAIDLELEMKNFQKASEPFCELWNNISIGINCVKYSYRLPTDDAREITTPTHEWIENHCDLSKCCLQFLSVMAFHVVENPDLMFHCAREISWWHGSYSHDIFEFKILRL